MILPDFILPGKANQQLKHYGIDSLEHCLDKKHFRQYPHDITYQYNSRGFRDQEWPETLTQLQQSIWCVGDSFTVGLGSPLEHIWPYVLSQYTDTRTINVSMEGASNNWISRKAIKIVQEIQPKFMIVHWSYISRREADIVAASEPHWQKFYSNVRDQSWPDCTWAQVDQLPQHILDEINIVHGGAHFFLDEALILSSINSSDEQDITNTLECIKQLNDVAVSTVLIHSFIPEFVPKHYQGYIESQLKGRIISELTRLDLARDGHHYDIKTSQSFCQQIVDFLN